MNAIKRGVKTNPIKGLSAVGFFASIGFALISTIWAVYLNSIFNNASTVGFVTGLFVLVGAASYVFFSPFVERNPKSKIYISSLALLLISYILFAILEHVFAVVLLGIITSVLTTLRVTSYGIMVRDKSKQKELSKNEGLVYTLINIAWLLGPIIAGYVAANLGERKVFFLAACFLFIALLSFRGMKINDNRTKKKKDKNAVKIFISYFKKKERVLAYFIGGGLDYWWSLIYIYVPLYIINIAQKSDVTIGYFLAAVVIPLILIEYAAGKTAAKKGYKRLFFVGFFILGIAGVIAFLLSNIYLLLGVLVLASFGAGLLEPTTESYFFETITKEERDKYYGTYNTTINANSFIGRILGAGVLLLFPFKAVFLCFGIIMFIFSLISLKVKR